MVNEDSKQKVEAVFAKWDAAGKGVIAVDKLEEVLTSLGINGTDLAKTSENGFVKWQDFLDGLFSGDTAPAPKPIDHAAAKHHWKEVHQEAHDMFHDPNHPYHEEIVHLRKENHRLLKNTPVSNTEEIPKPRQATLIDNTMVFLPPRAVHHLGLEPNMDDKGDTHKEMWFGRIWELRELLKVKKIAKKAKKEKPAPTTLTDEGKEELSAKLADPSMLIKLKRMAAHWKGAHLRNHCKLAVLEKLRYANLMGTLIYAHGSGGLSWDNSRICRQICKLGILVIAPDGFAHPPESAMGQLRRKDVLPLTPAHADVDYWTNDLIYASGAKGDATYSTDAQNVLNDPDAYRDLYEKCFQLRRSELHLIISKLPIFIKVRGFFLGGTSEGGMTIARFDDQRYGKMVLGRFINSFSVEYCYFTPVPEAAEIGGQLDVPTLNIIGDADEYFGAEDSVASIVAADKEHGYGDAALTGNAYKTFVRQGMKCGLVCVTTGGTHGPCATHDNFLRQLFETFFTRPAEIYSLADIWKVDYTRSHLVANVTQSTLDDPDARTKWWRIRVVQLQIPRMRQPQTLPLATVEAMRLAKASNTAQIEAQMAEEQAALDAERQQKKILLEGFKKQSKDKGGQGFKYEKGKANYYAQKAITKHKSIQALGGIVEAGEKPAEETPAEEKPAEEKPAEETPAGAE